MGTLIKQECFKLFKKKSTFIIPIVIIAIMLILAIVSSQYSSIFSPEENFKMVIHHFHGLFSYSLFKQVQSLPWNFIMVPLRTYYIENIHVSAL